MILQSKLFLHLKYMDWWRSHTIVSVQYFNDLEPSLYSSSVWLRTFASAHCAVLRKCLSSLWKCILQDFDEVSTVFRKKIYFFSLLFLRVRSHATKPKIAYPFDAIETKSGKSVKNNAKDKTIAKIAKNGTRPAKSTSLKLAYLQLLTINNPDISTIGATK